MQSIHETLKAADADLQQLDVMLSHHSERLLAAFEGAMETVDEAKHAPTANLTLTIESIQQLRQQLAQAVLHLQFQDISSQMLSHCQVRLQACQTLLEQVQTQPSQLAEAMTIPPLQGPVTQASLDAGTIELFDTLAHPSISGDHP
ncbi:hypothetical protein [Lampropedia aestuarii]|uniref:hypothetical protein n=1 Tax=Lampropedia aestuarii TaxID=2562762 RepID=UPI0024692D2A|nr:hypothetical protein [Lampropedia aestuarii]MDH5859101.1 hypothetical protein [Lampropedia aestuarii]